MTDDEIKALALTHSSDNVAFARAIIAAYTAKLRQGVELPEPRGKVAHEERPYEPAWISSEDAYDIDQLLQYGDARDQAGYLRGLEDAKRVCIERMSFWRLSDDRYDEAENCAAAIDKLKGGE